MAFLEGMGGVLAVLMFASCAAATGGCPVGEVAEVTQTAREHVWDRFILEPLDTHTIDQGWLLVDGQYSRTFSVDDVLYQLAHKCPDELRMRLHTRHFTNSEREIIRATLELMSPMFAHCGAPPIIGISKANAVTSSRACRAAGGVAVEVRPALIILANTDETLQGHFSKAPLELVPVGGERKLSLGDTKGDERFRIKLIHELAHAITDWLDPRTCSLRTNEEPKAVLLDFMKKTKGTRAVTTYGATRLHEDLAEAITLYFVDPVYLFNRSRVRFDFVQSLMGPTSSVSAAPR